MNNWVRKKVPVLIQIRRSKGKNRGTKIKRIMVYREEVWHVKGKVEAYKIQRAHRTPSKTLWPFHI